MKLTHHAKDRAKERLGIPSSLLLPAASVAMSSGIPPEEYAATDPLLHRYLMSLLKRHRNGGANSMLRVASEHVWIWTRSSPGSEWVLITIRPLRPEWASRTPREAFRFMPPPSGQSSSGDRLECP